MKRRVGVIVVFMLVASPRALPQSATTFTYQGELRDGGGLADGLFDMTFSLWRAAVGGLQIGETVVRDDVPVVEGRFTVQLDYGAAAFNNESRFLEITVEGSTLAPRQPITRSPYAVQTRGLYVDEQNLVGVGTTSPDDHSRMTVKADGQRKAIHASSGTASWPTIYGFNGNTLGHVIHADGIADAKPDQGGVVIIGQLDGENVALDGNELMARDNGEASTLHLNLDGGHIVTGGRLGVGVNPGFAQLAVHDTDPAVAFGLEVQTSQQSALPSILATNRAGGPVIWAHGSSDVSLEGGGFIVAGEETGQNLAIDNNEIMARDNGNPATLHLNLEGGPVVMGEFAIKPPYAYGKISEDGAIISASSNVTGVSVQGDSFLVHISGGFRTTDVAIATDAQPVTGAPTIARCQRVGSDMQISTWNPVDVWEGRNPVSFVIFRP